MRIGRRGVAKQIFLGTRTSAIEIDYIAAFIRLARTAPKRPKKQASIGPA